MGPFRADDIGGESALFHYLQCQQEVGGARPCRRRRPRHARPAAGARAGADRRSRRGVGRGAWTDARRARLRAPASRPLRRHPFRPGRAARVAAAPARSTSSTPAAGPITRRARRRPTSPRSRARAGSSPTTRRGSTQRCARSPRYIGSGAGGGASSSTSQRSRCRSNRVDCVLDRMLAGEVEPSAATHRLRHGRPRHLLRLPRRPRLPVHDHPRALAGAVKLMGEPDWARTFREDWLEFDCTRDNVAAFRGRFAEWVADQDKRTDDRGGAAAGRSDGTGEHRRRPAGERTVRASRLLPDPRPSALWPRRLSRPPAIG